MVGPRVNFRFWHLAHDTIGSRTFSKFDLIWIAVYMDVLDVSFHVDDLSPPAGVYLAVVELSLWPSHGRMADWAGRAGAFSKFHRIWAEVWMDFLRMLFRVGNFVTVTAVNYAVVSSWGRRVANMALFTSAFEELDLVSFWVEVSHVLGSLYHLFAFAALNGAVRNLFIVYEFVSANLTCFSSAFDEFDCSLAPPWMDISHMFCLIFHFLGVTANYIAVILLAVNSEVFFWRTSAAEEVLVLLHFLGRRYDSIILVKVEVSWFTSSVTAAEVLAGLGSQIVAIGTSFRWMWWPRLQMWRFVLILRTWRR